MDERAAKGGETGREVTALVVRYMDGRPARIHDDTDDGDTEDVCFVYEPDTVQAAADWLIAERQFVRWCNRSEAVAELVMVTMPEPGDPADLEASINAAASRPVVSYGFVGNAELRSEAG